MYYTPMQLISNLTKYLILVLLLACSTILTCTNVTLQVTDFGLIGPLATTTTETANTIWDSMRREFSLDHQVQTAQVQKEIRRLVADPDRFNAILKAAGPYMYFIYKKTHAYGLPMELALIPFIESEFNPNDRSNKGATGLWQLMPQTAKDLGVKVKSGYDGRRNVVASTNAALAYFNDLGNNFNGNWYLAIAAYNCGPGCVEHAKRRTGTENFWQLPVPKETKYYVPRLLAVAAIIENPEKYGIELPPIDNTPYFKEVPVDKTVSLEKVSKTTGVNIKTLAKLNPDAKGAVVPNKNGVATLLLPVKKTPEMTTNNTAAVSVASESHAEQFADKSTITKPAIVHHVTAKHYVAQKHKTRTSRHHRRVMIARHQANTHHHPLFPTVKAY